jgi:hypothetical protein
MSKVLLKIKSYVLLSINVFGNFFYKPFPYNLHRCMNRLYLFLWSDSFPFGKIKADTLHNDIESCTCKTLEWHIYDALRGNNDLDPLSCDHKLKSWVYFTFCIIKNWLTVVSNSKGNFIVNEIWQKTNKINQCSM